MECAGDRHLRDGCNLRVLSMQYRRHLRTSIKLLEKDTLFFKE